MMWKEFEQLAGYKVSYEDYTKIIEPMYMATNLSKQEFIQTINRKKFEKKSEPVKLIKVMSIHDNSGYYTTPNGCYRHLVNVEVVRIDIRTGKITVKVIPNSYRLGYEYDICDYDCVVLKK